jgi:hypothetical protein
MVKLCMRVRIVAGNHLTTWTKKAASERVAVLK